MLILKTVENFFSTGFQHPVGILFNNCSRVYDVTVLASFSFAAA